MWCKTAPMEQRNLNPGRSGCLRTERSRQNIANVRGSLCAKPRSPCRRNTVPHVLRASFNQNTLASLQDPREICLEASYIQCLSNMHPIMIIISVQMWFEGNLIQMMISQYLLSILSCNFAHICRNKFPTTWYEPFYNWIVRIGDIGNFMAGCIFF